MGLRKYLPFFTGKKGGNVFSFRILIPAGAFPASLFTIPLTVTGTYNFIAKWGDGTSNHITTLDGSNNHTYANPGYYVIKMVGQDGFNSCTELQFNNSATAVKVTNLINIEDLGFTALNFYGCTNLADTPSSFQNLTHLVNCIDFMRATNVNTLNVHMFENSPNITTFENAFRDCVFLTSVPADTFRFNTAVTTFKYLFSGCVRLPSITPDIFRYNTSVTNFFSTFSSVATLVGAINIPTDIFRYNTAALDFTATFSNMLITESNIPTDLFRYNTAATTFFSTFFATEITTTSTNWFQYNTAATTFRSCFASCTSLATVGAIFSTNTAVTSFLRVFNNCTILETVAADLFRYNTVCLDFTEAFASCPKMQQHATIFYQAGGASTRFLNQLVNFTNCFLRTSFTGTQGTAPDLWNVDFGTGSPTRTYCWGGAGNSGTSLTNYASIPVAWL